MKTLLFQSSFLFPVFSNIYLNKGAAIRFIRTLFRYLGSSKTEHGPVAQKGFKYLKCRLESLPFGNNDRMLFSRPNKVAKQHAFLIYKSAKRYYVV